MSNASHRHLGAARRIFAGALCAIAWVASPTLAQPAADPLLGNWWGVLGSPRERVETGFTLREKAAGGLELVLTQPIANTFAVPQPDEVLRSDRRIQVTALGLDLALEGDVLVGHFFGPNSPARFERISELPGPTPIPALPTGPGPRWQTRLGGQISAGAAVADGVAYVGTSAGVFNAVDIRDGELRWTFSAGRPIFGDALVVGDAVYFAADNGWLFKLARGDGRELWRYDLGDARVDRVLGHPAVFDWDWQGADPVHADGVIFVGSGDGTLHAVDAATGARRWRFATGGKIRGGAAIAGEAVVFGSADHFVYALDRTTGRELWRRDTQAAIENAPLALAGTIYVGNRGGGLYALSAATGEQLWRLYFWGSWVESTPVAVDGTLYIGSSDLRRVSAIAPDDGKVRWRTDVWGWTFGTPVVTADRVYAGAAGGTPYFIPHEASLVALDRASGQPLWRWPIPTSSGAHQWGIAGSLALAGDTLVATTLDGSIYGFTVP